MAYPVNYVRNDDGTLTVVRINNELLIRVIHNGETKMYICTEPDSAAKFMGGKRRQVMCVGAESPEELFNKIDAQS